MDNSGEWGIRKNALKEEMEGKTSNGEEWSSAIKKRPKFSECRRAMEQTPYFPQPIYRFNLNFLIIQRRVDSSTILDFRSEVLQFVALPH